MLGDQQNCEDHGKFKELSALAGTGTLTPREILVLNAHLEKCEECREVAVQYLILKTQGIPTLAATYSELQEQRSWDEASTRQKLLARVRADQQPSFEAQNDRSVAVQPHLLRRMAVNPFAQTLLAACLVITVGFGAYGLGLRAQKRGRVTSEEMSPEDRFHKLAAEKKSVDELLAAQAKKLTRLQEESSQKEQELAKLRAALRAVGDHSNELAAAHDQSAGQLQALLQQRDALNAQLQDANQSYQSVRAELISLRGEHDKTVLRTNSLEARIEELTAVNRAQERRLKDTEQYLTSDRDIRELMGARKLYIADVFDVDSGSRTRKPFGRVFYTQGKSLIFYAFDLDRQPGVVNANAFQVWGQKETAQGERALPMNLGILYMDNESNRRWVMRFDDPKQLAEIDAVFVTVEPRGGSQKPTSKPFLYALLRNEVNHP
jgi:Anti-sigma-K factor rskA